MTNSNSGRARKKKTVKDNRGRRGRPVEEDSAQIRSDAVNMLFMQRTISLKGLTEGLGIDAKTARRVFGEIKNLPRQLTETTGGELNLGQHSDLYYVQQLSKCMDEKLCIAERAAHLARGARSVVACAGTTVAMSAKHLCEEGGTTTLVTNNLGIVDMTAGKSVATIELTGGTYLPKIHACVGLADEALERTNCEVALIGLSGISAKGSLYVAHAAEVPVLRQMLKCTARTIFIVLDPTKLGVIDTFECQTLRGLLDDTSKLDRKIAIVTTHPDDEKAADKEGILNALKSIDRRIEIHYANDELGVA